MILSMSQNLEASSGRGGGLSHVRPLRMLKLFGMMGREVLSMRGDGDVGEELVAMARGRGR